MRRKISTNRLLNKKGSYILESAICLPMLFIAMVVLSSIILLYACIEDANFILANQMRLAAIEGRFVDSQPALPLTVGKKVKKARNCVKHTVIKDYGYKIHRYGFDELILLTLDMKMKTDNPMNLMAETHYELSLVTRAYVGRRRDLDPMSEDEFMGNTRVVYVFPKMGERYHGKSCTFVRSACRGVPLTNTIKLKYGSCTVCKSKDMKNGSLAYVFPAYGENYHRPGCKVTKRHCIAMDIKTAKKRGYSPCQKCGGG